MSLPLQQTSFEHIVALFETFYVCIQPHDFMYP